MALTPATQRQVPDHAIMDFYYKQAYLGNQFVQASNLTASASETPAVLLTCPVQINAPQSQNQRSLFVSLRKLNCLTSGDSAILRFYLSPSISANGTAASIYNLRPASPTTPVGLAYTIPSISSSGNYIGSVSDPAYADEAIQLMVILDPGQSLLVTMQGSAASTAISTTLSWWEL